MTKEEEKQFADLQDKLAKAEAALKAANTKKSAELQERENRKAPKTVSKAVKVKSLAKDPYHADGEIFEVGSLNAKRLEAEGKVEIVK